MNKLFFAVSAALLGLGLKGDVKVISVSEKNPRYFVEGATQKAWIPVGCNICFDRLYDGKAHSHNQVRANFDRWIRRFAANGGNCIRLWAGHPSLEVMPDTPCVFDEERTKTLKGVVSLCEELGVKIKVTLENFKWCRREDIPLPEGRLADPHIGFDHPFNRRLYAPFALSAVDFFESDECRRIYMAKVRYLKDIGLGDSSAVYCFELMNEINGCAPVACYSRWSAWALGELKTLLPKQLVVNNLGSYSDVIAYQMYDELSTERDNDFMQIHRYLDTGASLDVCRGAMDVIAASAVRELLNRRPDRPAIVAEIGAVQANHAGPFPYYPHDKEGTLLHDALFAAFFAGSAGCGQFWHWDHQYIDANNLWWHFRRFANAIDGLDPIAEDFRPFYTESRRIRMYGLRGKKTVILWCRDKKSSWEDELVHGDKPEVLSDEIVPFQDCKLDCYLPWENRRVSVDAPKLPPFMRSIVVRIPASAQ